MKNLKIIFLREYLIRVKKKSFLLTTLLAPLGFALLTILPAILTSFTEKNQKMAIFVYDEKDHVYSKLKENPDFSFYKGDAPIQDKKNALTGTEEHVGILEVPEDIDKKSVHFSISTSINLSLQQEAKLRSILKEIIREKKLAQAGVTKEQMETIDFDFSMSSFKISAEGEEKRSSLIAAAAGYAMSILIYMFLAIYGSWVMRGVIEEKTSRVVEVIISSVKPIELMFGKIFGIAAVGLTQFSIWVILVIGLSFGASLFIDPPAAQTGVQSQISASEMQNIQNQVQLAINSFNVSLIFYFLFYFLAGFLLYGSLFAALGAMVDQESDGQQLTIWAMLPLIIPMMFLGALLQNPNGTFAIIASLVPFFSPIVMMIRLASVDVPWYEILASMLFLLAGVWAVAWFAARIYRIGILMYGKKYTMKDAFTWVFQA
jgi:ABC-2 type transport system permease protein